MGEQAELLINGDVCEGCGEEMGDGPGYPRRCSSCGGGDEGNDFDVYKHARQERRTGLEPKRIEYAIKELNKVQGVRYLVGIQTIIIHVNIHHQIDFWPYTGWFCGRKPIGHIKGRGIANLIKGIKNVSEIK